MAKSLAFWLDSKETSQTPDVKETPQASIELHFNNWLLNMRSKQEINYLDVGVKFRGLDQIKSINFFFPFEVKKENYHDLGLRLYKDRELIPAIFNAHPTNEAPDNRLKTLNITFANDDDNKLRLFCEIEPAVDGTTNGVIFTDYDNGKGTILSFPCDLFNCPTDLDTAYGYFRFRINISPDDKNSISQIHVSKDSKLLSRVESTEIVDFRVNEIRDLPQRIVKLLNNPVYIATVHFFLIRETNSELKLSHAEFKRCRILEKELWDSYLRDGSHEEKFCTPGQMLIYHWKESKELKEEQGKILYLDKFSAFAKFSTITATNDTLRTFMAYIIVLGIISGVFANFIFSYFQQDASTPIFIGGISSGVISAALFGFFYSLYKSDTNKKVLEVIGVIVLYGVLIKLGALANTYFSVLKPDSNPHTILNFQVFIGGVCSGAIAVALFIFFYPLYRSESNKKNIKKLHNICFSGIMCIMLGAFANSYYPVLKPSSSELDTKADIESAQELASDRPTEHAATLKK